MAKAPRPTASTIAESPMSGVAMAAPPAVAGFVGAGVFQDALGYSRAMSEISAARNPKWPIPALEFAGTPTGIDIRRVVETGIAPAINTGIARAPLACFENALLAISNGP